MATIKEITKIIIVSEKNLAYVLNPKLVLKNIKLKKITPNISDKLVSYVTNSLIPLFKFQTEGIAMALLIILNGIALIRHVLKGIFVKY